MIQPGAETPDDAAATCDGVPEAAVHAIDQTFQEAEKHPCLHQELPHKAEKHLLAR